MNILLTGGSGQVGQSLQLLDWSEDICLYAPLRGQLDLANEKSIIKVLTSRPWHAIINAGAYTAVDAAEKDVAAAWKVNALAPALMAAFAKEKNIPIMHISTDYVFSGESKRPWVEADPVGPLNVYGASKEAGEQAIRTGASRHLILRTSWVVSPFGKNFAKTMLRLAQERPELRIVGDQTGRPTLASDLAPLIQILLLRMMDSDAAACGTYHTANEGETSWADFARAIFKVSQDLGGPEAHVATIATQEYPTPARRPLYSTLSTARLLGDCGLTLPAWREGLPKLVEALLAQNAKVL